MKRIAFFILLMLSSAVVFASGKNLSALFGYSIFYLPENNQPYVETYLNFDAWSLNFTQQEDGRYRATVEVTIVVRRNDTVAYLKKYDLNSPYISVANETNFTFFDLQRFGLANGIYDLEVTLHDKASDNIPNVIQEKIIVFYKNDSPMMSNIQLMASASPTESENMLSRNGYDMIPYIDDFVPAEVTHLHPYFELYNTHLEIGSDPCSINVYVVQKENGRRIPDIGQTITRKGASGNTPVYADLDISNLPSGNYNVVVEVLNNQMMPFFKKETTIMRSNPQMDATMMDKTEVATSFVALITDEELINYYIDALYPVSSPTEVSTARNLIKQPGLAAKQAYLYNFWKLRNFTNPEEAWNKYLKNLNYVDEHFSYPLTRGYRTDMGRVYLQYGPPDFVRDEKNFVGALGNVKTNAFASTSYEGSETSQDGHIHYLPYQLWRYNTLPGDYGNRVFIFWDEFRSGFYKLLNSNAMGEIRTAGWERMLSRYTMDEGTVGEVGAQFNRGY